MNNEYPENTGTNDISFSETSLAQSEPYVVPHCPPQLFGQMLRDLSAEGPHGHTHVLLMRDSQLAHDIAVSAFNDASHLRVIVETTPSILMGKLDKIPHPTCKCKIAYIDMLRNVFKRDSNVFVCLMRDMFCCPSFLSTEKLKARWMSVAQKSKIVCQLFTDQAITNLGEHESSMVIGPSVDYLFACKHLRQSEYDFLHSYAISKLRPGNLTKYGMRLGFRVWSKDILHTILSTILSSCSRDGTKFFWEMLFACKESLSEDRYLDAFLDLPTNLEPAINLLLHQQLRLMQLEGADAKRIKTKRKIVYNSLNIKSMYAMKYLLSKQDVEYLLVKKQYRIVFYALHVSRKAYKPNELSTVSASVSTSQVQVQSEVYETVLSTSLNVELHLKPREYADMVIQGKLEVSDFSLLVEYDSEIFKQEKDLAEYLITELQRDPTNGYIAFLCVELHFIFEPGLILDILYSYLRCATGTSSYGASAITVGTSTTATTATTVGTGTASGTLMSNKEKITIAFIRLINYDLTCYTTISPIELQKLINSNPVCMKNVFDEALVHGRLSAQFLALAMSSVEINPLVLKTVILLDPEQWVAATCILFCTILNATEVSEIARVLLVFASVIPGEHNSSAVLGALKVIMSSKCFKHPNCIDDRKSVTLMRSLAYKLYDYIDLKQLIKIKKVVLESSERIVKLYLSSVKLSESEEREIPEPSEMPWNNLLDLSYNYGLLGSLDINSSDLSNMLGPNSAQFLQQEFELPDFNSSSNSKLGDSEIGSSQPDVVLTDSDDKENIPTLRKRGLNGEDLGQKRMKIETGVSFQANQDTQWNAGYQGYSDNAENAGFTGNAGYTGYAAYAENTGYASYNAGNQGYTPKVTRQPLATLYPLPPSHNHSLIYNDPLQFRDRMHSYSHESFYPRLESDSETPEQWSRHRNSHPMNSCPSFLTSSRNFNFQIADQHNLHGSTNLGSPIHGSPLHGSTGLGYGYNATLGNAHVNTSSVHAPSVHAPPLNAFMNTPPLNTSHVMNSLKSHEMVDPSHLAINPFSDFYHDQNDRFRLIPPTNNHISFDLSLPNPPPADYSAHMHTDHMSTYAMHVSDSETPKQSVIEDHDSTCLPQKIAQEVGQEKKRYY